MVFSNDGHVRWKRLEGLLESASVTDDWDVQQAASLFSDFVLSNDNAKIRVLLANDITMMLDSVGLDAYTYALERSGRSLLRLPGMPALPPGVRTVLSFCNDPSLPPERPV